MQICKKSHFIPGCVQGAILYLVCLIVSVCVTFVVSCDRESCTKPIATKSGSMVAEEYGLTRGSRFLACRLKLDAVAGMLSISWCVLGRADFSVFFFLSFYCFERKRPAASMRLPWLIYLCVSNVLFIRGVLSSSNVLFIRGVLYRYFPLLLCRCPLIIGFSRLVRAMLYRILEQCMSNMSTLLCPTHSVQSSQLKVQISMDTLCSCQYAVHC